MKMSHLCVCVCVCVCATGACNRVITARLWLVAAIIGSPSPSSHFLGSLSLCCWLGWAAGLAAGLLPPVGYIHTHISERQQCCLVSGFEEVRAVREIKRKIPKTHTATQKGPSGKETNKQIKSSLWHRFHRAPLFCLFVFIFFFFWSPSCTRSRHQIISGRFKSF